MTKLVQIIGVLFLSSLVWTTHAHALKLKSNVIVLMDFSNSYFTPERKDSAIPRNIRMLASLIADKNYGPKKPTLVQILPITDLSEQGRPVCEFVLHRKKLLGNKKPKCGPFDQSFCSADPEQFMTYMTEECSITVQRFKESNSTDISGALSLAGQLGQSQARKGRFLVIFSDMFEYRDPQIPISKVDLNGFDVLVVCGADLNNEADSLKFCRGTEKEWGAQLRSLGAGSVTYVLETGNWTLEVGKRFFD